MAKNKPLFDEMVVYLSPGSTFTMESKDLGQLLSDHGALVVVNINSRVSIFMRFFLAIIALINCVKQLITFFSCKGDARRLRH